MQINLTITLTASAELLAALTSFIGPKAIAPVKEEQKETPKPKAPVKAKEEPAPEPKEAPKPTTTLEVLRKEIGDKSKEDGGAKKSDILALLKEYGVTRATDLKEEHYAEFILKLRKI